jgi:hypothetical protein
VTARKQRRTTFALAMAIVACVYVIRPEGSDLWRTTSDPSAASVRLDVVVTRDGRPVTGLTAGDFVVTDTGASQTVEGARLAGHVAVAFVFDGSADIRRKDWPAIQTAAGAIVGALGSGDTGATVLTLDRLVQLDPAGTSPATLARSVSVLPPPALARKMLWDAVLAGASLVAPDTGRPVVVAFSDGGRDSGWTPRKAALATLAAAGFIVDAVTVPNTYSESASWDDVKKLPGAIVVPAIDSRLRDQFAAQFDRLRQGYVLTYHPTGVKTGDGFHSIKVTLTSGKADIQVRDGYFSGQ